MEINKLKEAYLEGLLKGDKSRCYTLVKTALGEGITLRDIYEKVFAPSMVSIGDLWEKNKVTVAQEHLATAITQSVISGLYEHLFLHKDEDYKGKMILTCVGDELHELGPRMLGDLIEMDGWDVRYLGANMPIDSVFELILEEKPDLVGISSTMDANKEDIRRLIKRIREEYDLPIPIMVGGLAFLLSPELFNYTGADFFGRNFSEALAFTKKVAQKRVLKDSD